MSILGATIIIQPQEDDEMKKVMQVIMAGMVVVAMSGCGQKGISTARLEKSFKGSESAVQASVQAIAKAVEQQNYAAAVAELHKLGARANLTAEQQAAIKDLIEQAIKEIQAAAEKKAEELKKALGK